MKHIYRCEECQKDIEINVRRFKDVKDVIECDRCNGICKKVYRGNIGIVNKLRDRTS